MRRRVTWGAAVLLGLSLAGIPSAANAEPSGCSHNAPKFWTTTVSQYGNNRAYMHAEGTGVCSSDATRSFRVEIKQDMNARPDPVTSSATDSHYGFGYKARTDTCDNWNNATYYGRSFFTSSPTYKDSSHYLLDTCE